jgi:hypothetical protein
MSQEVKRHRRQLSCTATWYNPGDHRYYLAARDMPNGPVLGVIDAKTNQWPQNVATNTNSHRVAADPSNNHVFGPLQSRAPVLRKTRMAASAFTHSNRREHVT